MSAKVGMRERSLAERNALPPSVREAAGAAIAHRVADLPEWKAARTVGAYAAIGSEVPTAPLVNAALAAGMRVALPRTLVAESALAFHEVHSLGDLRAGAFRVPEPDPTEHARVPRNAIDVLAVPGVSFDRTGHRLGYGRGFFDRFLDGFGGLSVGLSYDSLLRDAVPAEPHDVRLDVLVTEARTLRIRP